MYSILGDDLDVARFLEHYLPSPGDASAEGSGTGVACAGAVPYAELLSAATILVPEFGRRGAAVSLDEVFTGFAVYTVREPLFITRNVQALLGTSDERARVARTLSGYAWTHYEPDAPDLQGKHVACATEPPLSLAATAETITTVVHSDDGSILRSFLVTQVGWDPSETAPRLD